MDKTDLILKLWHVNLTRHNQMSLVKIKRLYPLIGSNVSGRETGPRV